MNNEPEKKKRVIKKWRKDRLFLLALVICGIVYGLSKFPFIYRQAIETVSQKMPQASMLTHGKDGNLQIKFVRQLVGKTPAERTIMFAAKDKKEYFLEYGKPGVLSKITKIKATDMSFKDGKYAYTQYMVKLKDLEPNAKYQYRIVSGDTNGSWHNLEVPGKDYTAIIFADSQSGDNYSKFDNIVKTAVDKNSEAKLWLNLGDQVDNGEHQYQWKRWFESVERISPDIPMAALVGNHECYDLNWQERFPVAHVNLFQFPSALDKYKNQFYSFDFGDVHFTCLDTNYRWEVLPYQPNIVWQQLNWVRSDLANSKAKWKVVLMHRDICMYGFNPASGQRSDWRTYIMETGTDFMPIFDQYNVDAVLSGHLHTYRRRVPLRNFRPNKEKGVTYIMSGVCGDQQKGLLWEDWEWDAKRSPEKEKETGNYMTMTVKDNTLTLKSFLPNGEQFDEVVLKK